MVYGWKYKTDLPSLLHLYLLLASVACPSICMSIVPSDHLHGMSQELCAWLTLWPDLFRVPTRSLFPGKVLNFDHGSLGPGKVLNLSNFFKKVMEKSLFSYQKQVDESMPGVKYFISLASSLNQNSCFANFPPQCELKSNCDEMWCLKS